MKIGIIGAMVEEVVFFQEAVKHTETISVGALTFYKGQWEGHEVVISKCGVGKVNAAITAQMMIDIFKSEKLVFTGVAGALDENLNVGDVVISTSCQEHDLDASPLGFERGTIPMHDGTSDFPASNVLVDKAYDAALETVRDEMKVMKGKIISGDQFIANKDVVKDLREQFQAACVEMEGAAVAHVANFNNIPYVVIRSISDKANGEAPESFESFVVQAAQTSATIVEGLIRRL